MNQHPAYPTKLEPISSELEDVDIKNNSYSELGKASSTRQAEPININVDNHKIRKRPSLKLNIENDNHLSPKVGETINLERLESEIEALLIYTKAVKWPTLKQTLTERRFLLRVFQLIFGLGAFLDIGYTSLINNYTSVVLESSGIPFYCFTSITSIFVSISNMFLYSFPGFLGIPPHRHHRVSRVEISFDGIITCLWIIATAQLAVYGACPNQKAQIIANLIFYLDISTKYCPTLQATLILGGIAALLFFWRFVEGIRDQMARKETGALGKHIMFARGSWKD